MRGRAGGVLPGCRRPRSRARLWRAVESAGSPHTPRTGGATQNARSKQNKTQRSMPPTHASVFVASARHAAARSNGRTTQCRGAAAAPARDEPSEGVEGVVCAQRALALVHVPGQLHQVGRDFRHGHRLAHPQRTPPRPVCRRQHQHTFAPGGTESARWNSLLRV
eukprot:3103442-Rhodomonas_salina.1